jgi:hypothetical protein
MGGEMSLFSDIGGALGAENAEDKQYAASQEALRIQRENQAKNEVNLKPYMGLGTGGTSALSKLYGLGGAAPDMSGFTQSPDYQFRLGQGQQALDRSAAARGGLFSGAAGKAAMNYGQNLASGEYDNYVNRLFGLTGVGQNAANSMAGVNTGAANNMGNIWGNIGNNQADAIKSQYSAWGGIADQGAAAAMGGMYGIPGAGAAGAAGSTPGVAAGGQAALMALFGG